MLRLTPFTRIVRNHRLRSLSSAGSGDDGGADEKVKSSNEHPIKRTFNLLRNDMTTVKNFFLAKHTARKEEHHDNELESGTEETMPEQFQTHCDILVIGGGGVGSSIAFWLKEKAREGLNVVVVERDPTYSSASTVLSVGGLSQQFSLPENIKMSLFGADFIRNVKKHLGEEVNINFTPFGHLTLATEQGAETLQRNSQLQNQLGVRNELLTAERLKSKFPWLNTDGIALGCHGLEKEGWLDARALLMGFKNKAIEYGAHYVNGEVINFEFKNQSDVIIEGDNTFNEGSYEALDKAVVQLPDGEVRSIKFAICVIAGGAQSGSIGRLARIGTGEGLLRIPLPVEPRKRHVYVINTQGENAPGLFTPLTVDPNGTYFRRDGLGGNYLCGRSSAYDTEPSTDNLDVDHGHFESDILPTLAHRVNAFQSAKIVSSWSGYYEHNMYDDNGIIGPHPYYNNLYIATGFSGHGIQQTPAIGRAISELIMDGRFRTIDLSRLCYDRLVVDCPMFESNVV